MPASWLKVPHFQQTTDGSCLEACACMVLAYLQHPAVESRIAQLFGGDELGTPSSRVVRLQQWGFRVTYGSTNLQQLQAWLAQGIPPIAFVNTQFLDYWAENTPHAVVIVGIDEEHVYLNDPAFELVPQIASLDGFLAAWIERDEVTAVIVPKA